MGVVYTLNGCLIAPFPIQALASIGIDGVGAIDPYM